MQVKLSAAERKTAIRAAKVLGLNVAGVDILQSNNGTMVLEVNSSPGLEGIEMATGLDVAGGIIAHIERRVGRLASRRRVAQQGDETGA